MSDFWICLTVFVMLAVSHWSLRQDIGAQSIQKKEERLVPERTQKALLWTCR